MDAGNFLGQISLFPFTHFLKLGLSQMESLLHLQDLRNTTSAVFKPRAGHLTTARLYLQHRAPCNVHLPGAVNFHVKLKRIHDGCITLEEDGRGNKGIALKKKEK